MFVKSVFVFLHVEDVRDNPQPIGSQGQRDSGTVMDLTIRKGEVVGSGIRWKRESSTGLKVKQVFGLQSE